MTDRELLAAYQHARSPEVFSQIVARYVNLVYSVALRYAKNTHLAQDIAQEVFITLLSKSPTLDPQTPLVGWLFTTTRLVALQTLRAAARRHRHEREVAMMQDASTTPDPTWPLIAGEVDDAVAHLSPPERDAILLRYFAGKSNLEIADDLAISEEAAKKRVQRAVDSLRQLLTTRGLVIPVGALTAALASHAAADAAPPTIAAAIAHASAHLATAAAPSAATITKGTLMAMTKMKLAAIAATALLVAIPASLVVIHLSSPASPTPPAAIAETPDLPVEFNQIYGLQPGQFIAHIAPPFPESRAAAVDFLNPAGAQGTPQNPLAMVFGWENGKPTAKKFDQIFGRRGEPEGYSVSILLQTLFQTLPHEIVGDKRLLEKTLPGDFVVSVGASQDELCAGLGKMLTADIGHPVTLQFRQIPAETYVLRGQWNYKPMPPEQSSAGVPASLLNGIDPIVRLYGDPNVAPRASSGGLQPSQNLATWLGRYIDGSVVVEATGLPPMIGFLARDYAAGVLPEASVVLDHVAAQTGLTWSKETRTVRRLVVEESLFPPPYALAPGEALHRIVDPPEGVRDQVWKTFSEDDTVNDAVTWHAMGMMVNGNEIVRGAAGQNPFTLSDVMQLFLETYPQEVEGESNMTLAGDFVGSQDSSIEQRRAALEAILRADNHPNLSLVYRDVPRKVIVFKGQWKLAPAGPPEPWSSILPGIDIYDDVIKPHKPGQQGRGQRNDFANQIGRFIGQQIFVESQEFPVALAWYYPTSINIRPAHRDPVLNHITEQTGLTWSEETRTVRRLFVEGEKLPENKGSPVVP